MPIIDYDSYEALKAVLNKCKQENEHIAELGSLGRNQQGRTELAGDDRQLMVVPFTTTQWTATEPTRIVLVREVGFNGPYALPLDYPVLVVEDTV